MLGLAAVVTVLLIIWSIRFFASSPGASQPTPTTIAQPPRLARHGAAPISAAEMTQYEGYAERLQNANLAAARVLASVDSTSTPAQLAATVTSYRSALNLYYFQLHFIHWTASAEPAVEGDYAQLQALMNFLQSFNPADATGKSVWMAALQDRTALTQAADNEVRHDLGLSASNSFP